MFTMPATDAPPAVRPSRRPRPVACPRSPELGARLTVIVHALRAQEPRERENRAAELAKLRELQRFD